MADLHRLLGHDEVTDSRSIAALFIAREFLAGRFRPQP
jgi:ADP-ribose diphosphatase